MDFINLDTWSVDWNAIAGLLSFFATLYAASVAWKISKEWNNQKGHEIVPENYSKVPKTLYFSNDFFKNMLNLSPVHFLNLSGKTLKDLELVLNVSFNRFTSNN